MPSPSRVLPLLAAVLLLPGALGGQERVTFSGAVGFARQGGLVDGPGERPTIGYSLVGSVEVPTFARALRLRGDATFADFAGDRQIGALSAGLVVVRPSGTVRPYLSGSGGFYTLGGARDGAGYAVGGGLRVQMGGRALLVETRVHNHPIQPTAPLPWVESRRTLWVPISLGMQF